MKVLEWIHNNFWNIMFYMSVIVLVLGYAYPNVLNEFDKLYSTLIMAIAIGFNRLEEKLKDEDCSE